MARVETRRGDGPGRGPLRRGRVDLCALARSEHTWHFLRECVLVIAAFLAYFAVRGLMANSTSVAVGNAHRLVDLEQALGFYWEPAWQDWIADSRVLTTLANWTYIYAHWPVIGVAAIWLFHRHHATYVVFRNAFFISGLVGLAVFMLFPVAPPRLAGLDFVDTITRYSDSYRVLQPPAFVNQYAAFPSLHFGWNLLIGIALWRTLVHPALRVAAMLVPAAMFFAVVATANHFIIDALAGGALSLAALLVAERLGRARVAPVRLLNE